ncbi:MAG: hypothetical protein RR846_10295, partial [Oscillospiraceae bacterium]
GAGRGYKASEKRQVGEGRGDVEMWGRRTKGEGRADVGIRPYNVGLGHWEYAPVSRCEAPLCHRGTRATAVAQPPSLC